MGNPSSVRAERREILDALKSLMSWDEDKALQWLTTPNPHFGEVAPSTLIVMGRGHKVRKFIESATQGEFP